MKKIVLVASALLITAVSFAQAKSGFGAAVGFVVEPYNYGGLEDVNPKMLNGFFVRGDYEFAFAEHSGVSAGLRFDYIGLGDFAKTSRINPYYGTSYSVKTTWRKAYIDVPVKYNAHFGGFYLNAGPVLKFLVSDKATESIEETGASQTVNYLKDASDKINKVYFGVGGGLGYIFKSGIKIFFEYDYNFTNVFKNTEGLSSSKPSDFSLGIGYNF